MPEKEREPLALPALRAHMGDWVYYVSFLKMRDIAERISIAEDIHSSKSLRDLLQRRLSDRSEDIRDYLLKQPQRFFNALVIGTYGGSPKWNELAIRKIDSGLEEMLEPVEGALGILTLTGSEKLFAVDGQHRVAGIKAAVHRRKSVGDEEVCVIVIAGVTQQHRSEDVAGFERTRRLFTTLNRYAKPVSKRDIIALDEDDIVAIVTRKLVEEHPLFIDKVSPRLGNSLAPGDRTSFTTITAVYDALDTFLPDSRRGWNDFKKLRPSDSDVKTYYRKAVALWDSLMKHYPPLKRMRDSRSEEQVAGEFRSTDGGHLLFRPIGFLLVVRVIKRLIGEGNGLLEAVRSVSRVPTDIAADPWVGLLWNRTNRRMITTGENKRVAERLLLFLAGGDLSKVKAGYNPEELRMELAGLLNRPLEGFALPQREV